MPPPIVFISPAIKHWVYNKWTGYHLHTTNWIYSNIILIKRVIIWASSWENRLYAYAKTKTQISVSVTTKLISAFVFAIRIVQSLYYLNSKFQASSHLLWLYSPVCVGPGRIPRRPVFSVGYIQMSCTSSVLDKNTCKVSKGLGKNCRRSCAHKVPT